MRVLRSGTGKRWAGAALGGVLLVWATVLGLKAYEKNIHLWFPAYVAWTVTPARSAEARPGPTHILFMVADHFEPGRDTARVRDWAIRFRAIALRHRDADGRPPRHTWFYPIEQRRDEQLEILAEMAQDGLGEIEVHFHHRIDSSDTYRAALRSGVRDFQRFGASITTDGRTAFGYIGGNWSLDNGLGPEFPGANDEITILREEGAFADFTFPAYESLAQPRMVNALYYAVDDPQRPKSYDTGVPVRAGAPPPPGGFLMVTGPLLVNWLDWRHGYYPAVEHGALTGANPPLPQRIDGWVRAGISVEGRRDWIVVKTFTHGASRADMPTIVGPPREQMHAYLEAKYNDGRRYRLHYVTARELYNIVKAAEAGLTGDPGGYRDYLIRPYRNSGRSGAARLAVIRR